MKKRKHSRIGGMFRRAFDFRYWADVDRIKEFSLYIWGGFKRLFIPQENRGGNQASFEDAVKKMNLSEDDLLNREKALKRLSVFMSVMACLVFSYSFYHLFYGKWEAVILCYSVTLIASALAFRYHFWYYQIKERKLGCRFSE